MRRLLIALAVICALAAGCGEKEESLEPGSPEKLELMLDFFPNADHAAIYAAEAGGHFKDVGLDVEIRQPPDPAAPLKQVVAGRVDLAISYEPEVLRARDQGLAAQAVGALVQAPLTSIISLPPAGIRTPEDLDGKVVGTAGIDYQSAYLEAIAKQARAKVEERNVGFNLNGALLAKKVDATLGAFWNYEGVDLRMRGKNPQIIRLEQAGIPTYDELVFVANADQQDDRIKRFMAALERGRRGSAERSRRGAEGPARREPGPRSRPAARLAQGDAAALPGAARQALRLAGPQGVERLRALDARQQAAREPDRRRGRLHERVPAGRGPLISARPRG